MASLFGGDMNRMRRALVRFPGAVERGGTQALEDIKDDWVLESRDIAPLDTGNLRRQISGEVTTDELIVSSNAVNNSRWGRFNYAYYIHEQDAGGHGLKTSGTVKKFLDESAESRQDEWKRWIEEEVGDELRREGVNVSWER